ncbi:asparagine synthase-related protein [Streptomyces sp. NPDC006175]|uniref:asparagine synthase-related protein n=1 Tax=unclassified Streptomyces TaxID=2593676 RepID=UPI0033B6FCAB
MRPPAAGWQRSRTPRARCSRSCDRPAADAHPALTRWLPPLLDRVDRVSMAVGLEVRVPFCDHRLIQYAWNIPWDMKSLGGSPKGVVRESVRDLLPSQIVDRPKNGHASAYGELLRNGLRPSDYPGIWRSCRARRLLAADLARRPGHQVDDTGRTSGDSAPVCADAAVIRRR